MYFVKWNNMNMDNCNVYIILADGRKWEEGQNYDRCYLLKFADLFLHCEWIQELQILLRISHQK